MENYGPLSTQMVQKWCILINKKWINSALNCEAYSSFHTAQSDHRIVTANVRLSLRANSKCKKPTRYQCSILRTDENVRLAYQLEIENRFENTESSESKTADTIYNHIIEAHKTEKHIPVKKKIKCKVPWKEKEITEKREIVEQYHNELKVKKTKTNESKYDKAKKDLQQAYNNHQKHYLEQKTK